jgi:hypothetical protein
MARLRRDFSIQLIALLALAWAAPTFAQEAPEAEPAGLYDRPTLVLTPTCTQVVSAPTSMPRVATP